MGLLVVGIGIGLLAAGVMAVVRAVRTGEAPSGHAPLHVAVTTIPHEPWAIAFREGAADLAAADVEGRDHAEVYRSLRAHGGVDFGETAIGLRLSTHHDAVVVSEISVVVVRRDPPFAGRLVGCGTSGAGASTPFTYNLDAGDAGQPIMPFIASHPITVRRDEPVDVNIVASTTSAYCQWRIHIDAGVDAVDHRMTVDDKGLPFETTGCDQSVFANGRELLP